MNYELWGAPRAAHGGLGGGDSWCGRGEAGYYELRRLHEEQPFYPCISSLAPSEAK